MSSQAAVDFEKWIPTAEFSYLSTFNSLFMSHIVPLNGEAKKKPLCRYELYIWFIQQEAGGIQTVCFLFFL